MTTFKKRYRNPMEVGIGIKFSKAEERYIEKAINSKASSLKEVDFSIVDFQPNVGQFVEELRVVQNDNRVSNGRRYVPTEEKSKLLLVVGAS